MKTLFILFSLFFTLNIYARKPNVIIIFTDDQGSLDMSVYGAKDLKTEHMDKIAKSGVRFTQFYAAAPVCSPSRVALLTGRPPQHGGLNGNVSLNSTGMPSSQITIAEEFKKAGYATAHIGKWHLGHKKETVPNGQGFDYSFGHLVGCIDNYSHFFYWSGPNKHDLWRNNKEVFHDGEFFPALMLKEASQFMDQNKTKPFFIYFALNTPHYPYQGTPEWLKYYNDKGVKYPRNLYNAFLSTTDDYIGKLLKKVDDLGLTKETIIVFQSDHGASTEVRAHNGGGYSGKFRGAKFSLFEGGIRVPALISWPGKIPANQVRNQFATGCDWYPTLLELTGLKAATHKIDGKSLVKVIHSNDAKSEHKGFVWKSSRKSAIREGKWKMHLGKSPLLYDIDSDPAESKNLAKENPELVQKLKKRFDKYWKTFEF